MIGDKVRVFGGSLGGGKEVRNTKKQQVACTVGEPDNHLMIF